MVTIIDREGSIFMKKPGSFRFESLEVWKSSIVFAKNAMALCDRFNNEKQFAISDQLKRAAISISNNIAEGSGSSSNKDFANFLNISRRSLFECVNLLKIAHSIELISVEESTSLITDLTIIGKQISSLRLYLLEEKK